MAILPGLIVAGLIFSASTYYDLDLQRVIIDEIQTVTKNIYPATTTQYTLGSQTYKWANIYSATGTFGETITIGTNTITGTGTTTISTEAGSLILTPLTNVGIGISTPPAKLTVYDTGNQLRLSYSDSYYADFSVDGGGNLRIDPTGGVVSVMTDGTQNYLRVYSTSTDYIQMTHSGTAGLLQVSAGNIEIGSPESPIYLEEITFISASSSSSTLTVTQSGTGDIVEFKDSITTVFAIQDGGNVVVSEINNTIYVDGTKYTQDSAGIQNAIDDLPSTGGKVILPEGTYNVDRAMDSAIAYDADDATPYDDETTAANNTTTDDMTLLPASPAVDDAYYFGWDYRSRKLTLNISTAGVGTWTITWEYWNGSSWTALSNVTDNTSGFTASSTNDVTYDLPSDWAKTTVNGVEKYFIRARVSDFTSITTQPKGAQAYGHGSIIIDKSYVTLEGVGESSKIYLTNNANVDVIQLGDGSGSYSNINVLNLQIDGNDANQTEGGLQCIEFKNNVTQSKVEGCYIHNAKLGGIYIHRDSSHNKILNNYIHDNGSAGSASGGLALSGDYNIVSGNKFSSNSLSGIELNGDYNVVDSNVFVSNYYPIAYGGTPGKHSIISNNSIYSSSIHGIEFAQDGSIIKGNLIRSTGIYGIKFSGSNSIISGNVIYEVGSDDDGIYLAGDNNVVSSNRIYDSSGSRYGINLASGADNNQVLGNEITGAGFTEKVHDDGSGNTIQQRDWFEIEASGTQTALTVTQSGTGEIVNLYDGSYKVFQVADGGEITAWRNATLTGANLTISPLSPPTITSLATSTPGSCATGTTYYYRVTASNPNGETKGSTEQSITTTDATTTTITITWDSVEGSTYYSVYRDTSSIADGAVAVLVGTTTATTLDDDCTVTATSTIPSSNTTGGNLAINTNTLYVDAETGRVGIGTTTPSYKLEVSGMGSFDYIRYKKDVWVSMADTPSNVYMGGSLVYTGGDYIYAFRGDSTDF
ncbi:right-handed parallel beta-helix repeat-containing protein, partial [bacterium]|nr:right-handed parallel beta-helix repeat-containing protein [bacterium]